MHSVSYGHLPGGWLASPAEAMPLLWHPHTCASCRPAVITCFLHNCSFQKHRLWGRDFRKPCQENNPTMSSAESGSSALCCIHELGVLHPPPPRLLRSNVTVRSYICLLAALIPSTVQDTTLRHTGNKRNQLCQTRAIYRNPVTPRCILHGNILRFRLRRLG